MLATGFEVEAEVIARKRLSDGSEVLVIDLADGRASIEWCGRAWIFSNVGQALAELWLWDPRDEPAPFGRLERSGLALESESITRPCAELASTFRG